jgi:hypothetical protein
MIKKLALYVVIIGFFVSVLINIGLFNKVKNKTMFAGIQHKNLLQLQTKFHYLKRTLLERTTAMMNCNSEYKKMKQGCSGMSKSCHQMMQQCDDIITNKKNCRGVHRLLRGR